MKVLLIQQKMIGDVLVSSLLCEHLKQQLPKCEVHYLINEHTLAVVENNPFIDTVVIFKKDAQKSKLKFYRFLIAISREKYDVVIDVYGKLESNLMTLFSGSKMRVSHSKWYSKFIYTHLISGSSKKKSKVGLAIENRLSFLSPLLLEIKNPEKTPKIYLTETEIDKAKVYLSNNRVDFSSPIVMIGILGSGENKTYPLHYMAKVIDEITRSHNATLLFNYIPIQREQAQLLYNLCNEESKSRIKFDLFAPSLRDFLGILYHCNALIGNEGGAVNMAKALNVPTFSIYSPWISKLAWHTFSDNESNLAVHLSDFLPDLIKGKSKKELKADSESLYKLFEPHFFQKALRNYLDNEIFSDQ